MCGIAGIIDLSEIFIDPRQVEAMTQALIRRGPDSSGLKVLPHAVFGHRRLSILDLSALGNQPMATPDKLLWTVFNGEIYNHLELRHELESSGYTYRSRTDTESLLYGFREWGVELSTRCRGMWAFAIWDTVAKTVYLTRDRMGEKPLFYFQEGTRLAFASTLAGLRPALSHCEINPSAVASFLAYEYIPHTECIYKGVQKLPPAHYLVFNERGIEVRPYWDLDYRRKLDISVEEAERLVEEILDSAVQEQLIADVPLGVFLSGGVDSGYLAALAARHKPGITTITMTVPGSTERDESANARQIAHTHATNHIEVPLDQTCIRDLPGLLTTCEPLGDSSIIPVAAVSQAAVQHLKVVLTGDGGDESFGGYGKPALAYRAQQLHQNGTGCIWRLLSPALTFLSRQRITPWLRLLRIHSSGAHFMAGAGVETYLETWEATPPFVRRLLYGPRLAPLQDRPLAQFIIGTLHQSLYQEWWEGILGVGIKTRLVDDFLFKVDTATMYHSLESRAPFLDHRLIELAARLPWNVWMPDEHYKSLLKRLAARHNPRQVVYDSKKGFSIPVEQYFLKGWGKILLDLTQDGVVAQLGLLEPKGIQRYLNAHGLRANYRLQRQLFSILVLEIWLRVFHTKTQTPNQLGDQLFSSVSNIPW